ncbi:AbrB/MazE/SpoVT family DNA-binding domain-containing protein [Anaerovorax odorimutans]|nr:AbrB/MazE/SpoVT family DNA-binding domain-containing protein [Anaerovorax odorimutans]
MKATGIVRRIDDLGRVVIPKEIRRTMRIREGDPLEIFTDGEGKITLKKYDVLGDVVKQVRDVLDYIETFPEGIEKEKRIKAIKLLKELQRLVNKP